MPPQACTGIAHCFSNCSRNFDLAALFDWLHAERDAFFLELRFIYGANLRRLILMLKQMAAFVFAQVRTPRMADVTQTSSEREMSGRLFAGREVMMVPAFRGHEQASRLPVHANEVSAGRPHERVTFAAKHNDLCARAMPVRFLIGAGFDRHDVANHRITRKMNTQAAETNPALGVRIELNRGQIRNEIDDTVLLFAGLKLAAEKIFLASKRSVNSYGTLKTKSGEL